ncbi:MULTISPECIES: transcriptional regulator FeaR [Serratia]|uniref:transcriptional regulator FeaR n=2 Tax=Serratia TaxID=613 RepID=UPI0004E65D9C|nr:MULTISPECIES: transcriptional regulator FeaR [Serratia]ASM34034.1 transcriptional regulator FeaR [Serratia marcescens]KFF80736.1 transcriptional regulator [Serratia marcescens]MCW7645988.1 transcriptional regulator FeaR [Serratia bockelmannii]MCW7655773.1 transcriptional regulator FeaR [Serratia bockelmannii]MCW7675558.1 transcriptional regulator FeaR [Serratia bockelmannii]
MTALATLRDVGFEEWLGKINTACGRFCAKTLGPGFSGAMQEFRAHALRLSVVDVSQARLYRTPSEIARSDGAHFFTVFQLRGSALMEQGDRQTVLSPGDMTLIDASRPSSFTFQRDSRQISLLMPRGCLPVPPPCAQRLGAELSAVRLSRQLVLSSMQDPQLAAAESEAVLNALAALLRPALALEQARPEGQQPVFDKALALIDRHIQSAQLRPEWVAAELGVSLRSLYRLFARQGLVVAQYIRNRRLDLCAQALRSAAGQEKLAGVGLDWGFTDHSHFSTAFKQRFGMSPSEYRRQYQ